MTYPFREPSRSMRRHDHTTPGFYHQPFNARAAAGSNYPAAKAGALSVLKHVGVSQLYVTYHNTAPEFHYRSFYGASWSVWRKLAHSGDINALLNLADGECDGVSFGDFITAADIPSGGIIGLRVSGEVARR